MSVGTTYGKYFLLKKLAAGGMGEVFLARQQGPAGFEKILVIKRILEHLSENEDYAKLFLSEARTQAQMNHSSIVQIFDLGQAEDGTFYMAMEFVHGKALVDLEAKAKRMKQKIPPTLLAQILERIADGLSYAHNMTDAKGQSLSIIHRDVSPHNVLVSYRGDVKLIDFGIAKSEMSVVKTETGTIKGKFYYMSPEQSAAMPLDKRSDIFSLGIVLYEGLMGENPFQKPNVVLSLEAIQKFDPPPPSQIDPELAPFDPIIAKALAKDRDQRYSDAEEMKEDLVRVRGQLPPPVERLGAYVSRLFKESLEQDSRVLFDTDGANIGAMETPTSSRAGGVRQPGVATPAGRGGTPVSVGNTPASRGSTPASRGSTPATKPSPGRKPDIARPSRKLSVVEPANASADEEDAEETSASQPPEVGETLLRSPAYVDPDEAEGDPGTTLPPPPKRKSVSRRVKPVEEEAPETSGPYELGEAGQDEEQSVEEAPKGKSSRVALIAATVVIVGGGGGVLAWSLTHGSDNALPAQEQKTPLKGTPLNTSTEGVQPNPNAAAEAAAKKAADEKQAAATKALEDEKRKLEDEKKKLDEDKKNAEEALAKAKETEEQAAKNKKADEKARAEQKKERKVEATKKEEKKEEKKTVVAAADPAPSASGHLKIVTIPAGLPVSADGRSISGEVPIGASKTTIEVGNSSSPVKVKLLVVDKDGDKFVTIGSTPPALVWVLGEAKGKTPVRLDQKLGDIVLRIEFKKPEDQSPLATLMIKYK